jgi:glycine hydroxymethyltransferase
MVQKINAIGGEITADRIKNLVQAQNQWRGVECINMIASENIMSPMAHSVSSSDFDHRYAEGLVWERHYQGQQYQDEIEQIAIELTQDLFGVKYAELRAPTATTANLAIFYGVCKRFDKYFSLSVPDGAHISFRKFGGAGCRGLEIMDIPFNPETFNVDLELLESLLLGIKPKLITLGGSVYLFPHPVKQIAKICQDTKTVIHYDASHVLGLIAGGEFDNPLANGADIMMGSSHKTFPGPQGAFMLTNNEKLFKKMQKGIFPGLVSNHHLWRFPPLAITLLEMKLHGKAYAQQTIKNAKVLAENLDKLGFDIMAKKYGYTASHQVIVDVSEHGGGYRAALDLEAANIICNKNLLYKDHVNSMAEPSGLRLGSQEITRMGMKEPEMKTIAEFYKRIVIDKEDPLKVKSEVIEFRSQYQKVHFTLEDA